VLVKIFMFFGNLSGGTCVYFKMVKCVKNNSLTWMKTAKLFRDFCLSVQNEVN